MLSDILTAFCVIYMALQPFFYLKAYKEGEKHGASAEIVETAPKKLKLPKIKGKSDRERNKKEIEMRRKLQKDLEMIDKYDCTSLGQED